MEQGKKDEKSGVPAVKGGKEIVSRKFEGVETRPANEHSIVAQAEAAKMRIQARFIMAKNDRRNDLDVRSKILQACQRSRFAEVARYRKKQGGGKVCGMKDCPTAKRTRDGICGFVCGPSVRFADEAVKFMGNIDVIKEILFEDEDQRIVQVSTLDLETNLGKAETQIIKKTIERRTPREGQEVIGERKNTKGELVFIIKASDDETSTKEARLCAIVRRNLELQLLAQDIIEEGQDEVIKTMMSQTRKDPQAALKAICDGFATLNIQPNDIEKYLEHELSKASPEEIQELREWFTSIREGQATVADFREGKDTPEDKQKNGDGKLAAGRHDHSKKDQKAAGKKPGDEKPKSPSQSSDSSKPEVRLIEPKSKSRDDLGKAATQMLVMMAGGIKPEAKELLVGFCQKAGLTIESFSDMNASEALLVYSLVADEVKRLAGS